MNLKKNNNLQK